MERILFSLTLDDRPDLLRAQIENLNHFCPDSAICIHMAAGADFTREELSSYADFDNVVINPASYDVINQKGCLHAHIGNFRYAIERDVKFDKILLYSSDEILLKPGMRNYVAGHALGTQIELYDAVETFETWSIFRKEILSLPKLESMLGALGLPIFAGGQAEGQFFSKSIFRSVDQLFTQHFPMEPSGFPSEQVIPATVAMCLGMNGTDVAMPVTLIDHSSYVQFSDELLSQITVGKGAIYAPGKARSLRPVHLGSCVLKDVFAVSCTDSEGYDPRNFILEQVAREGKNKAQVN